MPKMNIKIYEHFGFEILTFFPPPLHVCNCIRIDISIVIINSLIIIISFYISIFLLYSALVKNFKKFAKNSKKIQKNPKKKKKRLVTGEGRRALARAQIYLPLRRELLYIGPGRPR